MVGKQLFGKKKHEAESRHESSEMCGRPTQECALVISTENRIIICGSTPPLSAGNNWVQVRGRCREFPVKEPRWVDGGSLACVALNELAFMNGNFTN